MRDIIIALIIFGAIPFVLARPYVGIYLWSWISYMNPHRLAWGFAYDFQFAALIFGAMFIGTIFSKEPKRIPWTPLTVVWFLLIFWMCFTTLFALSPDNAVIEWERTMKIMLGAIFTLILITRRERLHMLIWVIVLSLGFYAVKGGIFTILTGGNYRVWGPENSFIGDNNSLGLALVMVLPLMRYLHLTAERHFVRLGLAALMILTTFAIVGTQSRGAFLAVIAMALTLWFKDAKKFRIGVAVLALATVVYLFMPSSWTERMHTIETYQQDGSAMNRITAWRFATNLALARPLVGGGFDVFGPESFAVYLPEYGSWHDSHSIYFEMLGEHGFPGLILFLTLGFLTLKTGTWVKRNTEGISELKWARDLATMLQVSIVGYAVGGAFLGLAYFDFYYHLVVVMFITRLLVEEQLQKTAVIALAESTEAAASAAPLGETSAFTGYSDFLPRK